MERAATNGGPRPEVISNHRTIANENDGSNAEFGSLIDRIKQVATAPSVDDASHAGLLSDIKRLQLAVERPLETIYRIGHQSWQNASIRIAMDLGIFRTLMRRQGRSVTAQELASICGADVVFLVRIMRIVVAMGLCAESGVEEYSASSKTEIMTVPQGTSSFKSWFDLFMPAAANFPQYIRRNGYRNPEDSADTAFASAMGSEFWEYLKKNPKESETFNEFMATRRLGKSSWSDIYPVDQELAFENIAKDGVLLVDVGGNRGHDLLNLKAKYPDLRGQMIVQDLPDVVAQASFEAGDNIKAMPHNFFEAQPIQNARAYHFRAILHDWPDSSCQQILSHTAAAMKSGYSKLLISEFVLTDTDTALFPASLDVQMMGLHAGMERSEKQWRLLLEAAGLEVIKIWQQSPGGESVIEARLKA